MPYSTNGITVPGATAQSTTDVLLSVQTVSSFSDSLSSPGVDLPPQNCTEYLKDQVEVPGSLGQRFIEGQDLQKISKAYRTVYASNLLYPRNVRYRGHREAIKFNLTMQSILTTFASLYLVLKANNVTMATSEALTVLTETEVAAIYHVSAQLTFHEWFLLRDLNVRWF